jgi:hypothetical protein
VKRFGLLIVAVAVVAIPLAYAALREQEPRPVMPAVAHPDVTKQAAKQPRFIRIPNAVAPCRCVRNVPEFKGKVRYDPLKAAPVATASSGSLRQGLIRAVDPTSITVGRVTCARDAPLDLSGFRVGSLAVIDCSKGQLVGIEPGRTGLSTGSVPIAPAGP